MKQTSKPTIYISLILAFILVLSPMASFAQEAPKVNIQSSVTKAFNEGQDQVEVLIKLKEKVNLESIAGQNFEKASLQNTNQANREAVKAAVVESLEATAEDTQAPVLNYLKNQVRLGKAEGIESYYIVNMIYVKATEDVVKRVAAMPEVEEVFLDEKVFLISQPVEEGEVEVLEEILPEETELGDFDEAVLEEQEETAEGSLETEEEVAVTTQNTTQVNPADIEWNIRQVGAPEVWSRYGIDGTGIVIGMIDSGVTWDHPALINKYRGYNPVTRTVNHSASWFDAHAGRTTPYDDYQSPHGTHVMGTILGQEASGRNAIGVAPGAKFIAAKGLGVNGGASSNLLRAAQWMLAPGGSTANAPDIINNSWGGGDGINNWFRDAVRAWRAVGILPVFAAGNQPPGEPAPWPGSISIPSNYPESFAVGATDSRNIRGSFSKLGPSPYEPSKPKPDISAPGVNIRSSVISGYGAGWNGTSMAAPNVSGVAALVLQANPNISLTSLESLLKQTATPLTDSTYRTSPNMGYGYGLVNALRAVETALGSNPGPTPDPTPTTGDVTGRITNDRTGAGLSGVNLSIRGTSITARTNSSGYYTLRGVPSGTRTLDASRSGYQSISGEIQVRAGETITVNGTMVEAPTQSTGTISGRITDNNTGRGISGVQMSISGTNLSTTTDTNGYYTLRNVPTGNQTLVATGSGYETISGSVLVEAGRTSEMNGRMVPSSPVQQRGTLRGRVTGRYTGTAISYARVSVDGTNLIAYTDRNGNFSISNVPSGSVNITIRSYGYQTLTGRVELPAGGELDLDIRLVSSSSYYGTGSSTPGETVDQPVIKNPDN